MAYVRLNPKTGDVITETVFTHLEDGIEGATNEVETLATTVETKADKTTVETLATTVETKADKAEVVNAISILYADLVTLRNAGGLKAGVYYRITDYVTTTAQENTQSAGHQFDLLVLATDTDKLSETARAVLHEGDTYFSEAGADLDAWQVWYSLDNDTDRFAWADAENGKGVIWRMIDEWGNDIPYDFKNIQFEGEYTFNEADDLTGSCRGNVIRAYYNSSTQSLNCIIFGNDCYNNSFGNNCNYNSFGNECHDNSFGNNCTSNSFGNDCYSNSFGDNCNSNSFGNDCYSNSFGNGCTDNSFGDDCYSNSFGNDCYSNSFGDNCNSNSFGNNCTYNSFGESCHSNSFGDDCHDNSFGNNCNYNSFGERCHPNSFGNNCTYNSFGESCHSNSFGNNCTYNSFGNGCTSNSFTDTSNTVANYVRNNSFGNGCSSVVLQNDATASSSQQIQNYRIANGMTGTVAVTRGLAYETTIAKTTSGTIKVFNVAELVL